VAASPTRHRGPAGKWHQQAGAQPSQVRPTRADEELDEEFAPPPDHDEDDMCFDDFWGRLFRGYLCCALFQFGGLLTGVREPKEHEFFNVFRCYKTGIAFLQELGLNWYNLSDSQQWLRHMRHELDSNETRTRCCRNTKSLISKDRQWGGTGILAHGLVAHFAVGSGGDKTGLGRWTWSRFFGKNGMHLLSAVLRTTDRPAAPPGRA